MQDFELEVFKTFINDLDTAACTVWCRW